MARQRIATLAPCIQAAFQRPDALDSILSEEQRHTGAGSFVRSSTVKNHLTIPRETVALFLELLGLHVQRSGNGLRLSFEIHRMAQIHDRDRFSRVIFFLSFIDGTPRDTHFPEEALAGDTFIADRTRTRLT